MTENDSGARQDPADNFPDRSRTEYRSLRREIERLRAGIQYAIEAIESEDTWLACDLLLALVDDGPEQQRHAA